VRAIVANSRNVAARIQRWWGRDSAVVHPPVDVDWYTPDPTVAREDFFLVVGRLVPYKKPLVAMAAAEAAGVRLVVAGEGRQLEAARTRARAADGIT
jgi:glycosyltransferase involved in cell wall biosynthesis